jgi:hypothetical protein
MRLSFSGRADCAGAILLSLEEVVDPRGRESLFLYAENWREQASDEKEINFTMQENFSEIGCNGFFIRFTGENGTPTQAVFQSSGRCYLQWTKVPKSKITPASQ